MLVVLNFVVLALLVLLVISVVVRIFLCIKDHIISASHNMDAHFTRGCGVPEAVLTLR
jgi:hypothetical protein